MMSIHNYDGANKLTIVENDACGVFRRKPRAQTWCLDTQGVESNVGVDNTTCKLQWELLPCPTPTMQLGGACVVDSTAYACGVDGLVSFTARDGWTGPIGLKSPEQSRQSQYVNAGDNPRIFTPWSFQGTSCIAVGQYVVICGMALEGTRFRGPHTVAYDTISGEYCVWNPMMVDDAPYMVSPDLYLVSHSEHCAYDIDQALLYPHPGLRWASVDLALLVYPEETVETHAPETSDSYSDEYSECSD
ncbi:hypothetical protein KIPB_006262 [Kipferlia bialata]|uniref:Uncharacterized protein n=1 Tax=Kipferlia bialata TaxID=797122 RepID=A0A9K3CWS1_9EUKA|nr:hypothetical protein KIPB_006262 [Kipferlia bialata]|eukprot:g6262.t1